MNRNEIVEKLAKGKEIEKIVTVILFNEEKNNLDDLVNDMYLYLLTTDPKKIERLYNDNELGFYLLKMVRLQIYSTSSSYHRLYRKNYEEISIDKIKNIL